MDDVYRTFISLTYTRPAQSRFKIAEAENPSSSSSSFPIHHPASFSMFQRAVVTRRAVKVRK